MILNYISRTAGTGKFVTSLLLFAVPEYTNGICNKDVTI